MTSPAGSAGSPTSAAAPAASHAGCRDVAVIGVAIALLHELRIELGRQLAASHGLHVGEQVDQIFDRRFVCGEPHRMRAGEC